MISAVIKGNLKTIEDIVESHELKEIAHIRGVCVDIGSLPFEDEDQVDTSMWNPLHFAVYYKHLKIVQYFIDKMKVNDAITLPNLSPTKF